MAIQFFYLLYSADCLGWQVARIPRTYYVCYAVCPSHLLTTCRHRFADYPMLLSARLSIRWETIPNYSTQSDPPSISYAATSNRIYVNSGCAYVSDLMAARVDKKGNQKGPIYHFDPVCAVYVPSSVMM